MNGSITLAKRYAFAYLKLFGKHLDLEASNRCEQAAHFLEDHGAARTALKLATVIKQEDREQFRVLCEAFSLPPSLLKLIDLLYAQKRLALLPAVLKFISVLYKEQQGFEECTISSSKPLDSMRLGVIKGFLEMLTGKKIISTHKVDPSLIAGIRAQSDTMLWEYSIRKQLNELQHQFNR